MLLPWGSIIQIHSALGEFPVAVGPPKGGRNGWHLPLPWETGNRHHTLSDLQSKVRAWRHDYGFELRSTAVVESSLPSSHLARARNYNLTVTISCGNRLHVR